MTKRLQALLAKIEADPQRRERVNKYGRVINTALALGRLRESQAITQRELATRMGVAQSNISRIEREDDVYLSTLRSYIENLGGRLEINAVFDNETITVGTDSLHVRPTIFTPIGQPLPKNAVNRQWALPFTEWLDGQFAQGIGDINMVLGDQSIVAQPKSFTEKKGPELSRDMFLGGAMQRTIVANNRATSPAITNTNALVA